MDEEFCVVCRQCAVSRGYQGTVFTTAKAALEHTVDFHGSRVVKLLEEHFTTQQLVHGTISVESTIEEKFLYNRNDGVNRG